MLALKLFGWIFFVIPLAVYLAFSVWMMIGISKDDSSVKSFFYIVFTFWMIGVTLLAVGYLSDWLLP